ncbi:cytochrome c biogenesis protein ResB [Thermodesulfobacteriota bacterium]
MGKESRGNGKFDEVLKFFSSVRLTVFLCIALAASSALGTFIAQNLSVAESVAKYGEPLTKLLMVLGIGDLYHSGWFRFLMALLATNLIVCSTRRLPRVWRGIHRTPGKVSGETLKKWRANKSFRSPLGPEEAAARASKILRCKPVEAETEGGGRQYVLTSNRGAYGRLGPYVTHLGVLILLFGAVIGSVAGFRGGVEILEGEAAGEAWLFRGTERRPFGFEIRCDNFTFTRYEDGTPRDYKSEVTILEEGQVVRKGDIRVNHPLSHKGINFYQSSYYPSVDLEVKDKEKGTSTFFKTHINKTVRLPDGQTWLRIEDVDPDMLMPGASMKGGGKRLGPAAAILLINASGAHQGPFWILKNYPDMARAREGNYHIQLIDISTSYYTGLQVASDPGVGFVWTGCIVLLVGIIMSFFIHHRTLVVLVGRDDDGSKVTAAEKSMDGRGDIEVEFNKVAEAIAGAIGPSH